MVVLKFSSPTCQPCKVLSRNLQGILTVQDICITKDAELFKHHGVKSVPTLIAIKGTEEIYRNVGILSKEECEKLAARLQEAQEAP